MEEDGQSANKRARLGSESDNVAECTKELFRLVNKSDNQGLKKLIDKTDASILQQSLEGYMEEYVLIPTLNKQEWVFPRMARSIVS